MRFLAFSLVFFVVVTPLPCLWAQESPPATPEAPRNQTGGGLLPLRPPAGTTLERQLRLEPKDGAPQLRELQDSDRILYLRTEGAWYEVDVRSSDGLEFRGWLKGTLPVERTPPPPPSPQPVKAIEQKNPLASEKYIFFWDKNAKERGSLRFTTGFQQIFYRITGIVTQEDSTQAIDDVPPGYNFYGGHFGISGEFMPMKTRLFNQVDFSTVIKGGYSYGLHRVNFANPFPEVPELAGQAYSIDTHTYRLEVLGRLEKSLTKNFSLRLGLGAGIFYHEAVPDLDPISGSDELVFVDNHIFAYSFPIEVFARIAQKYYVSTTFYPFFFGELEEVPEITPNLKLNGFTFLANFILGWQFSEKFSAELEIESMDTKGKGTGTVTRLGTEFTDGQVKTQYRKIAAGIRWWF